MFVPDRQLDKTAVIFYIESLYAMENDPAREIATSRVDQYVHAFFVAGEMRDIHNIDNAPMMSKR